MACGCEGKKYNIGFGCCQPVLGPIENYYTKYQIDEMLDEIESAITSGCCITPEEVDEKIDEATSGLQQTLSAGTGIDITDNIISCTITGSGGCDCDLSDYVTFDDMAEYVGDVYTKTEVNNLFVTKQYFSSNTISRDVFITTIYNLQQQIDSLKSTISGCCGSSGETEYRWITVPNDYVCSGTTKMTKEKQQSSTDSINWTDTGQYRTGSTVLEYNSQDCGYVPVITNKVSFKRTNGTEEDMPCDGSSVLKWMNPASASTISGVTIGSCITELDNLCLFNLSGLTSVVLPDTITRIGVKAFDYDVALPSISIPSGVTTIEDMAFFACRSLSAVTIPSGVTTLEYATFMNCSALTSVTLAENLKRIDNNVFSHCSFSDITIPSTVESIGEYAFSFNKSLESITCLAVTPPVLDYQDIFQGCSNISAIYVPQASVDAYKAAWSEYAGLIQPIQ